MSDVKLCLTCNAVLEYDEVDVGVGIMRGNYRCQCGWCEGDAVILTSKEMDLVKLYSEKHLESNRVLIVDEAAQLFPSQGGKMMLEWIISSLMEMHKTGVMPTSMQMAIDGEELKLFKREDCCDHDEVLVYGPTFVGGDIYRCRWCGKEIDMMEDDSETD